MRLADWQAFKAAFLTARAEASDATASKTAVLYQTLKQDGALIHAGTKINWHGTIRIAAVDLWDTAENTPDNAPTLWDDIPYRDGIRIIPETITVTTAFHFGERGWWGEELYESLAETNVYTPEQYPPYWKKVTE